MEDSALPETLRLVESAQGGDEAALEALFKRYLPRVRQIVALRSGWRVRKLGELEDILQNSLLAIFRGIDRFEPRSEGSFRSWVAECVECEIVDYVRKHKAQKRGAGGVLRFGDIGSTALRDSIFAGKSPTPSRVVGARELEDRIEKALLELPDHYREVIILRNLCEMSFEEIAEKMAFGQEATARKAFSRAVKKLKEQIGE